MPHLRPPSPLLAPPRAPSHDSPLPSLLPVALLVAPDDNKMRSMYIKYYSVFCISFQDIIQESHTYEDIEIKSHKSKDTILVSRVVLAASSPFFKQCLKDMEDGGNITITDCCFESLSLTMKYLQTGFGIPWPTGT